MSKRCPFFIFLLAGLFLCGGPVFGAPEAASYRFQVVYEVSAGGMRLLNVTQDFSLTTTDYASILTAKPTGFFSRLVPWDGRYATVGTVHAGRLVPLRHTKNTGWGDEEEETLLKFGPRGDISRMTNLTWQAGAAKPPARDVTPDAALTKGAVDLVTGVLQMLQNAQGAGLTSGKACQAAPVVFDGKRRFVLQFTDLGQSRLTGAANNSFSGIARHCQIEVKPLAGFTGKKRGFYKIQEDSRAQGGLPSLWLMPAYAGGPPIPVRMVIHSGYGTVVVQAVKVSR